MKSLLCTFVILNLATMLQLEENNVRVPAEQRDRDEILGHVRSIFDAYVARDRKAIEATHTADWVGFQVPSRKIERGIEAYMKNADSSLEQFRGLSYELHDTELQILGDVAVLYYVASYRCRSPEGDERTLPLRSVDIYRREGDEWNQCGSNICVVPPEKPAARKANAAPQSSSLSLADRAELLAAREAVWRAWFTNDVEHLRSSVPEDVIAMDLGETVWAGRTEILARAQGFADGGAKLVRLSFPETRIQLYGSAAVLYTTYEFELERDGVQEAHSGRGTEIFERRNGTWVNTGWHLEPGP